MLKAAVYGVLHSVRVRGKGQNRRREVQRQVVEAWRTNQNEVAYGSGRRVRACGKGARGRTATERSGGDIKYGSIIEPLKIPDINNSHQTTPPPATRIYRM